MGQVAMLSRPWDLNGLAALWAIMATGASLAEAGRAIGRTPAECDRALWVLTGRTPAQAVDLLNRAGQVAPAPAQPRGVRAFIRQMFGGEP